MIYIIWEFQIDPSKRIEFENKYGPQGEWVSFFNKSDAYQGTTLIKDGNRYLTIDKWTDIDAFEQFKSEFDKEYQRIDEVGKKLTFSEKEIGIFIAVEDKPITF